MCGGVIVITATIAVCTMTIDASPSCTIGDRRITTARSPHRLDRLGARPLRIDAADDRQRIGAETPPHDRRGEQTTGPRQTRSARRSDRARGAGESLPLRCQDRTEDGTERSQPHDRGDRPSAPRRVRRGRQPRIDPAARPPARRRTGPSRPGRATPSASAHRTRRRRLRSADHQRRHHRRTATAAPAERSERRSHERRAEGERGAARAGEAVVAEQIADEQREDRDHPGDRSLPGNLRQPKGGERPPLQRGAVSRDLGEAHWCGLAHGNDGRPRQSSSGRRKRPVWLASTAATSSGLPSATTSPPPLPPSGPRSMIQSAVLMTSRLCSMTNTVLP